MANPSKRTKEAQKKICDLIRSGVRKGRAVASVDISRATFAGWVRDDPAFAEAVRSAKAGHLASLEMLAYTSARGNLKVSQEKIETYYADGKIKSKTERETVKPPSDPMLMFLLERLDRDRYGRQDTLKLIPPEKMSDDDLKAELLDLATRLGVVGRGKEEGPDLSGDE